MNKIAEVVTIEGEIVSLAESTSEKEFEYKILNSLDFETVKSFFIKKIIIQAVKDRHAKTNGSNGVTAVEMMNLLKREDVQAYLEELEAKRIIKMRKGINSEMYFVYKK